MDEVGTPVGPNSTDTLSGTGINSSGTSNLSQVADRVVSTGGQASASGIASCDLIRVKVTRDAASATDNIAADVFLLSAGITIDTKR
jgi:hypothetical protein